MRLLVSSLRPVQWIMGFCGLVAAFGVYAAHNAAIWNPTDALQSLITTNGVILAFLAYSILTFTSALLYRNSNVSIRLRWMSSVLGMALWISCLSSSFYWVVGILNLKDAMNLLYGIPLMADTWVVAQLLSNVDSIERREYD